MLSVMIWYDMIWYDMIWYDMIWYDMIWYDMIWYDMIWYDNDMIWYDIWYDMIWYDLIWYGMISYQMLCYVLLCYVMLYYVMLWRYCQTYVYFYPSVYQSIPPSLPSFFLFPSFLPYLRPLSLLSTLPFLFSLFPYTGCQRYGSLLAALNLPCCENWEWVEARSYLWPRTWGLLNMPNQSEEVLNRQSQILTLQVDWLDRIQVLTIVVIGWLGRNQANQFYWVTNISRFNHMTSKIW